MVGPPYAAAIRLSVIAAEWWVELDAHYVGVDLLRLPTHRFFNAVQAWCLGRIDPEKREEWLMQLDAPLNPDAPPTEAQLEAEGQAFMSVFGGSMAMPGMR